MFRLIALSDAFVANDVSAGCAWSALAHLEATPIEPIPALTGGITAAACPRTYAVVAICVSFESAAGVVAVAIDSDDVPDTFNAPDTVNDDMVSPLRFTLRVLRSLIAATTKLDEG